MVLRKVLLVLLSTVCFGGALYADGIASREEAYKYFNEGVKAQKKGDFEQANKQYAMVMMLTSKYNKYILHNRGVMYAVRGDYASAAAAFKDVLELDPNYMPAKLNLGRIYDMQADRCTSLEYWANLLNMERAKPKSFIMEEEKSPSE
ncbi:MAG: tetratricopeptide repeat protein [Candidatus Omnitrophica bacterium]|nr:tetratricopeptide repeat protein [Candidatus Omnitrophota bacterium]